VQKRIKTIEKIKKTIEYAGDGCFFLFQNEIINFLFTYIKFFLNLKA
jgi:hypothetical protein